MMAVCIASATPRSSNHKVKEEIITVSAKAAGEEAAEVC